MKNKEEHSRRQTELLEEMDGIFKKEIEKISSSPINIDWRKDYSTSLNTLGITNLVELITKTLNRKIMAKVIREYVKWNKSIDINKAILTLAKMKQYYENNIPKGFVRLKELPNYAINKEGEVINIHNRKLMKPQIDSKGYVCYYFRKNKTDKIVRRVHRLLLQTFKPIENDRELVVDHIDGNKLNNALDNLEYVTQAENASRAGKLGLVASGETHHNATLTEEDVKYIYTSNIPTEEIAKKYNIASTAISKIRRGIRWKRVTKDLKLGIKEPIIHLSEDDVKDIYTSEASTKELATKYNKSVKTIQSIKGNKTWTHITKDLPKSDFIRLNKKLSDEDVIAIYTSNKTRSELAEQFGVCLNTISKIDNGVMRTYITKGLQKGDREKSLGKLKREDVIDIYASTKPTTELAKQYNINPSTINAILKGTRWNRVTKYLTRGRDLASVNILTEQNAVDIYTSTKPIKELAEQYGVSNCCIADIRGRRRWKHVTKDLPKVNRATRLTEEQKKEILELSNTKSKIEISKQLGISLSTVKRITKNG